MLTKRFLNSAAIAILPIVVAACGDAPSESTIRSAAEIDWSNPVLPEKQQTQTSQFETVAQCVASKLLTEAQCQGAFAKAQAYHRDHSPRFTSQADCEREFDAGCTRYDLQSTDSHYNYYDGHHYYSPLFHSFAVGRAFNSAYTPLSIPLYRSRVHGFVTPTARPYYQGSTFDRSAFAPPAEKLKIVPRGKTYFAPPETVKPATDAKPQPRQVGAETAAPKAVAQPPVIAAPTLRTQAVPAAPAREAAPTTRQSIAVPAAPTEKNTAPAAVPAAPAARTAPPPAAAPVTVAPAKPAAPPPPPAAVVRPASPPPAPAAATRTAPASSSSSSAARATSPAPSNT